MQQVVIDKPHRFVPPDPGRFLVSEVIHDHCPGIAWYRLSP
jgi:hypothetical protein